MLPLLASSGRGVHSTSNQGRIHWFIETIGISFFALEVGLLVYSLIILIQITLLQHDRLRGKLLTTFALTFLDHLRALVRGAVLQIASMDHTNHDQRLHEVEYIEGLCGDDDCIVCVSNQKVILTDVVDYL